MFWCRLKKSGMIVIEWDICAYGLQYLGEDVNIQNIFILQAVQPH